MSWWNLIVVQIVLPTAALTLSGLVGLLLTKIQQMLHIHAETAANQAIQGAVANFAGKLVVEIQAGHLTLHDVLTGGANAALNQYAQETVKGSIDQLGVQPQVLSTMLVGKIGQMIGGHKISNDPNAIDTAVEPTHMPGAAPAAVQAGT